jgi:hypothetical protein
VDDLGIQTISDQSTYRVPVTTDSEAGDRAEHGDWEIDPLEYPFDVPTSPYMWDRGQVSQLTLFDEGDSAGRIPVLAIGSNASPRQLSRKFYRKVAQLEAQEGRILVVKVVVRGIDIVHSAHLSGYGSLPVTVTDVDCAKASVFLTWLTPHQFDLMNESERLGTKYQIRQFDNVRQGDRYLSGVYCYESTVGPAVLGGEVLALEGAQTVGSPLRRGSQADAWTLLAAEMGLGDGYSLVRQAQSDSEVRTRVEQYLASHRLPLSHPGADLLRITEGTSPAHHIRRNRPYVVAVSEEFKTRLKLGRIAEVSNSNNGRTIRTIAAVVVDNALTSADIGMDQTLRAALGMPRRVQVGPLGFVSALPVRMKVWQWLADKASWIAGRRYVLFRIAPPDPPDIEKNLCRMQAEDLGSLAVTEGDHVLLLHSSQGKLRRASLQALSLSESVCESRRDLLICSWEARYPDSAALLNIESRNDLRPIFLDFDARARLGGLRPGDAVMARRSLPSAMLNQLLDFGVVLLASILALRGLIPDSSILAVLIGLALTVFVVVVRLRTKLS